MGRTTRWFKGLFGSSSKKENQNSSSTAASTTTASSPMTKNNNNTVDNHHHHHYNQRDNRIINDKKRWSFAKTSTTGKESPNNNQILRNDIIPVNIPEAEAAWLRSFYSENNNDQNNQQNKHAIAVAAATAAAADAAVAAAQAAVAVVRLTSHGRGTMFGCREKWAVIKIQSLFRGFLARKALRALKGLVKLQAVVRGYLVRKQATATLYSMQALIRAQNTVRSQQRTRSFSRKDHKFQPPIRSRYSLDDSRSEYTSSIHSRRMSSSIETSMNNYEAESPKIVEIDTNYRPKSSSRARRPNVTSMSDLSEEYPQIPPRLSIPDNPRNYPENDWGFIRDHQDYMNKYSSATAQSTPRFANSGFSNGALPVTPAKSVCANSHYQYSCYPSYMANTQSFRAKVRSSSAPKQRPSGAVPSPRKKLSLIHNDMVESRISLSSNVRMRKSCSQVQDVLNFKNTVMGNIGLAGASEEEEEISVREDGQGDYLPRRW